MREANRKNGCLLNRFVFRNCNHERFQLLVSLECTVIWSLHLSLAFEGGSLFFGQKVRTWSRSQQKGKNLVKWIQGHGPEETRSWLTKSSPKKDYKACSYKCSPWINGCMARFKSTARRDLAPLASNLSAASMESSSSQGDMSRSHKHQQGKGLCRQRHAIAWKQMSLYTKPSYPNSQPITNRTK